MLVQVPMKTQRSSLKSCICSTAFYVSPAGCWVPLGFFKDSMKFLLDVSATMQKKIFACSSRGNLELQSEVFQKQEELHQPAASG
ncbi:hypothetical protein ATANTOWER_031859 [Ataeniobius toweri]|uniref:Uncharacterized protein n=1 Tax=Ataeniobius toweri TaxID=208326 RepID=A0ABU7C529_9TELE|nr:hypothetical protein [Ataeniobius toweri]